MEDHQLQNMVTVWYMGEALSVDPATPQGWFRDHPLKLRRHEQDDVLADYSVLRVSIPPRLRKRQPTEPKEMLQPLAELCRQVGDRLPEGEWRYEWYYFELLDKDERVQPLCWVDPSLLYEFFPAEEQTITQQPLEQMSESELKEVDWEELMGRPYRYQLATMDGVTRTAALSDSDREKRDEWRDWLVRTWRVHEQEWLKEGRLSYETVRPWSRMLAFDPALLEAEDLLSAKARSLDRPLSMARRRSYAGYPGLYWHMVPLYDARHLSLVWEAMKQELYVTSVFNPAARQRQDPELWKRLQERFVLPFQRMSHYRYLVRLREQKVLEWTRDEGKTLSEIARLLVDSKLHPLDPAEADRVSRMSLEHKQYYYQTARRVAVRIRKRLREAGRLERLPPGRPRKKDN